ncbi:hypothetical protein GCM10012275_02780 [Longimycelium tulufanense]|uniref:Uncharacterized protein n=1 Tax=Longimycelium tulufanense TaxID=907463 RepID=A0A8J3FT25_9PSEU|nr:hypothetical protein GCM10012275_02780 [Longimycelium tulufanense]
MLPLLFVAAALGVAAVPFMALGWQVEVYGALFGAGVAVGLANSDEVEWRADWQRHGLRWPYLAGLGLLGIAVDGMTLPAPVVAGLGAPAAVALMRMLRRTQRQSCLRPRPSSTPVYRL